MDVALQLFAERGFAATTMDDIADAAGVTKPLLYQHFESKRGLYLELVGSLSTSVIEAIAKATASAHGPRQQVEMGFKAYFHLLHTRTAAFRLLSAPDVQKDPELSHAGRRIEEVLAEQTAELIDAGLDPQHRRLLGYAVVGMVENAGRHFLGQHGEYRTVAPEEVDRLAQRLADLAWAGLRAVHDDA
jgi:AcrR family transcriptional regulator